MNIKPKNKFNPEFQTASITDFIFLLLIFFVLTSMLMSVNAMKFVVPASDVKTTSRQSIAISITKDLNYYVDQKKVSAEELKGVLKEKIHNMKNPSVVLTAEKSVPIEKVAQVMNFGYELKVDITLAK